MPVAARSQLPSAKPWHMASAPADLDPEPISWERSTSFASNSPFREDEGKAAILGCPEI